MSHEVFHDQQVACAPLCELPCATLREPLIIDETEHGQTRLYAELLGLQVAGLKVERRSVLLFPVGYYDTEQRHINGILGRDVIADSLVFGFDRDQGVAMLSTSAAFTAPPDAIATWTATPACLASLPCASSSWITGCWPNATPLTAAADGWV